MFKGIKNSLATRIAPTGEHLAGLRGILRSRLGLFKNDRSVEQQHELTEDFVRVLAAWGINDPEEIPGVIHVLRLRYLVFALPICVCGIAAAVMQHFIAYLTLALISAPCLLGILTTSWRVSVLAKRRFLPFWRWLLHMPSQILS